MELLRALATLVEAPAPEHSVLARTLELGEPPTRAEYSEVFSFQLYPYASVYLGPEGMLGGEARDRIAGFWRALGELPPTEPDHLAVMLAFWAELEQAESSAADEAAVDRWRHVRSAFLLEHVASWLPLFLDKLASLGTPFYRRWGELVGDALTGALAGLAQPAELPLHLREAPGFADPREEGAKTFLGTLLAPVRSGLVLVRSDLERAANELELGTRKGERRYVLEALLGQDDAGTLEWLAREAEAWAERHAARSDPYASFWRSRAEQTARLLRACAP